MWRRDGPGSGLSARDPTRLRADACARNHSAIVQPYCKCTTFEGTYTVRVRVRKYFRTFYFRTKVLSKVRKYFRKYFRTQVRKYFRTLKYERVMKVRVHVALRCSCTSKTTKYETTFTVRKYESTKVRKYLRRYTYVYTYSRILLTIFVLPEVDYHSYT